MGGKSCLEGAALIPIVIIADDHPLFRDALRQAISGAIPDCKVEMVGDLDGLRKLLNEISSADLVLLDLSMPGSSGFSGLISIRAEFPETPVVVVSASEDTITIKKCIELGASGFIPKSSGTEYIVDGIKSVQSGEVWVPPNIDLDTDMDAESAEIIGKLQSLTPQQTRVLSMLGEGLLNKQIAYELDVSEATVKAHVSAVLLKLDVDSRTQAVIIMNKIGSGFLESAVSAD
ncbi:MAG: response regulator transcription factor [Pseudomonadota bacterium]